MKTLRGLLLIIAVMLIAEYSAGQKIGYLIAIDKVSCGTRYIKTRDVKKVNELFKEYFEKEYDFSDELKSCIYVQHRNNNVIFYVEKKRIVVVNGKVKYKTIKKSRLNKKVSE